MFIAPFLFVLLTGQEGSLKTELLPSGAFAKIGGYAPIGIKLTEDRPETLKKLPNMDAPKFGSVHFGGRQFIVAVDKPHLYVDSNADGDLTDDPPTVWAEKTFTSYGVEKKEWEGFATVNIPFEGKDVPCRIGIYQQESTGQMGCYADFALVGTINLKGAAYPAIVDDTSGKFETSFSDSRNCILLIDLERNGHYNPGYEFFPIAKPFNIGGTTYEVKGQAPNFAVVKSLTTVAERTKATAAPPDPNLGNGLHPGSAALKFTATTTSGHAVAFPTSYAGKVVLIDFWATWCGPCMREVPNVVDAYQKYHGHGFEILGVSLDQPNSIDSVKTVTANRGMTWDQVYDGKYWQSAIPTQYQIKAIPESYLVDGDTGKILAMGEALRGPKLQAAIGKALESKGLK